MVSMARTTILLYAAVQQAQQDMYTQEELKRHC